MTANLKQAGYIDELGRPMGMFLNMPEAEYHAVKAFSYSGSKQLRKSPAHFKAYLEKEWEIDPDREKFKAVHLLTLEPEHHSRIVVKDGRWAGALKKEVQALQAEGKIVLKQDGLDDAKAITASIKAHELANNILSRSLSEVSFFAIINGVYCKGRIDIFYVDEIDLIIGDLKNYGDLSKERNIHTFIHDNVYYWQMYFYSLLIEAVLGRKPTNHYWFLVEDKPPHGVKVRVCTDAMLDLAAIEMEPLFETYKECTETNNWPCYEQKPETAGLPSYAWEKHE
jgi:predicted RNA-binding protein YlqC (UPF0109 family)